VPRRRVGVVVDEFIFDLAESVLELVDLVKELEALLAYNWRVCRLFCQILVENFG
jgi:hypothetical protein